MDCDHPPKRAFGNKQMSMRNPTRYVRYHPIARFLQAQATAEFA